MSIEMLPLSLMNTVTSLYQHIKSHIESSSLGALGGTNNPRSHLAQMMVITGT